MRGRPEPAFISSVAAIHGVIHGVIHDVIPDEIMM
jgi:hypothetical protein